MNDTNSNTLKHGERVHTTIYGGIRILLGIVFLSAAVFRIFNLQEAQLEMSNMKLPAWSSFLVIAIELAIAVSFLTNRCVKRIALGASIFLAAAISLGCILHPKELYAQLSELFVFDITVTDVVLHLVFLYLLILICRKEPLKHQENTSDKSV
jgi:uncharacterized membrane protein YphA (DoxX/SURF4 family)